MKAVTPADLRHFVRLLRDYPSGVTPAQLREQFGSDVRGFVVMANVQAQGLAAVVKALDSLGRPVFKVAASDAALNAELAMLDEEIEHLQSRRRGVQDAYAGGGIAQEGLF